MLMWIQNIQSFLTLVLNFAFELVRFKWYHVNIWTYSFSDFLLGAQELLLANVNMGYWGLYYLCTLFDETKFILNE